MHMLDVALHYWEHGWSVIPIHAETKKPVIKWKEYQTRQPTEEELSEWWGMWPDAQIALVTGELCGKVVVDCDSPEAVEAADACGMISPIMVKTPRGEHRYFDHPKDGQRRGPRAGGNSRGVDWPKIKGLDFRGDGSYVLLPPSTGYQWRIPAGLCPDDTPLWQDWVPEAPLCKEFDFSSLDLSGVATLQPDEYLSEWDRTARYVRETFPSSLKIPTGEGNGRNERVMRHLSDCIMDGKWGAELRLAGYKFMKEFFDDALPEPEFQATCRSVEEMERRNHPERFDATTGEYIPREARPVEAPKTEKTTRRLLRMSDAERLIEKSKGREMLIEPWLPPSTIVQVYGYSGHGKSMFLQHALAALCSGCKYFGPFEISRAAKVLYFDWENGAATLGRRLVELQSAHGDTEDRLNIWTPFAASEINLRKVDGLKNLQHWIDVLDPDVVVIDTIRSAYPGMQENNADEWAQVNQLATRIRNAGKSLVLVHHSNKPGDSGHGREAGSTNQLTVLETQIRVMQVFQDEEQAKIKAGVYDGDYTNPIWPMLTGKLPDGYRLYMVNEIRYGKVREWTDEHDEAQWIGYASHDETDARLIVSSKSSKQRARDMAAKGIVPEAIATSLQRPLSVITGWIGA